MLYIDPNSPKKKKQDKQYQKGLYYKYSLLGYQAVSYKQKKGKGFQKHNVSIIVRTLGAVLYPNPKG
jgi:hypothetical protein